MTISNKDFNLDKGIENINNIINNSNDYINLDYFPNIDRYLTFTNGVYINNTAFFIDLRRSSELLADNNIRTISRIYRAYISEVVMALRSQESCKEINIVGDCVSAIFVSNPNDKKGGNYSDVIDALETASMLNPLIKIIEELFNKHYGKNSDNKIKINAGIGIARGKALVLKTGEKGSGINKPIFLGDNVNTASHLCDKANKDDNNDFVLVNKEIIDNCGKYIANSDKKSTFKDFLIHKLIVDNKEVYGGTFYRISFNNRLNKLKESL